MLTARHFRFGVKPAVFVCASVPILLLAYDALWTPLRANPYPTLVRETGYWSLRFLILCLAVTPLRVWSGWAALVRLRRMLGLFAAFYAGAHFGVWAMDYGFDWPFIVGEIAARTYLWIGFIGTAFLLLLALTSVKPALRALGGQAWQRLHRLVYPAAILAWLHYWLAGRLSAAELPLDSFLLLVLLGWRLWRSGAKPAQSRHS